MHYQKLSGCSCKKKKKKEYVYIIPTHFWGLFTGSLLAVLAGIHMLANYIHHAVMFLFTSCTIISHRHGLWMLNVPFQHSPGLLKVLGSSWKETFKVLLYRLILLVTWIELDMVSHVNGLVWLYPVLPMVVVAATVHRASLCDAVRILCKQTVLYTACQLQIH